MRDFLIETATCYPPSTTCCSPQPPLPPPVFFVAFPVPWRHRTQLTQFSFASYLLFNQFSSSLSPPSLTSIQQKEIDTLTSLWYPLLRAVVLANGRLLKTASRAGKSADGYDLARLIIDSEGTLEVITEVTLCLQKLPSHSVVARHNFPVIKDAADVANVAIL